MARADNLTREMTSAKLKNSSQAKGWEKAGVAVVIRGET